METKTLKINAPEGCKIDKENSTFENIVFSEVGDVVIKWNKKYNGVEIKADGEHFILDTNPSYTMSWNEAMRFYNKQLWKLPTVKQLQVVHKYFDEINNVIDNNCGFLLKAEFYWCNEEKDEFESWYISLYDGYTYNFNKNINRYVRAVYTL